VRSASSASTPAEAGASAHDPPAGEERFAARVDALAGGPGRRGELAALLREDHPAYDQRGTAATVRMRGWVLLALARGELPEAALIFVLEELDTGTDAYLVAAAARALRSHRAPSPDFAPFLVRALEHVRFRDEPVCFDGYGEYAVSGAGTSPVRELLATLAWLGPHARGVRAELEAARPDGAFSRKLQAEWTRTLEAIGGAGEDEPAGDACCALPEGLGRTFWRALDPRRVREPPWDAAFQDHAGASVTFRQLFEGKPTIVVFFYTRCDNPLKCSLTITRLARVQALLEERGLGDAVNTAAITYDPAFDLPERLRRYGEGRGVRLGGGHRMLRALDGIGTLRAHFDLGVNFTGSLVNRHRVEVYVLDARGRVAALFERLHWDEREVVERTAEVLEEAREPALPPGRPRRVGSRGGWAASPVVGTLGAVGLALFPRCPMCWAAYLSMLGIAGLEPLTHTAWVQGVLAAAIAVNLGSVWLRGRASRRMEAFWLVSAGTAALLVGRLVPGWESAAALGVALTSAGTLLSTLRVQRGSDRAAVDSHPAPGVDR
jgi:protein SCO1/2